MVARPIVLVVFLLVATLVAHAEPEATEQSRQLTREAYEVHHRAEKLETDWAEVYDRGVDLSEKAIALDPKNADAYYALFLNLGRKSERSGVAAQAANIGRLKELLAKTLELDPRHAHAWEARGEMLMRLPWLLGGSDQKGLEALQRSAELAPEWAKPELRLAEYYWRKGDSEKARTFAERARDLAQTGRDEDWLRESQQLLEKISRKER